MRIYQLVPEAVKDYVRIMLARRKYPGRNIGTPYLSPDVTLGERCSLSRMVELGPGVTIGDYSYINSGTIVASGRIGRFCSIGSNCQIGMADHPIEFLSTSPFLYGPRNVFGDGCHWEHYGEPPEVGSDVWIGAQVFIRQGVTVGHGAVIGAGSIVVKDIPPYAIAAGVPARVLRYRFSPATVERLLERRWWDLPVSALRKFREDFLASPEPAPEPVPIEAAHA
jgi:acetyltransferase-like isoleucine patch superfamily enzyme